MLGIRENLALSRVVFDRARRGRALSLHGWRVVATAGAD